ncbi:hypothetical protein IJU97_02255 [bacterium]|nr:hypothetical protein [bacterium]
MIIILPSIVSFPSFSSILLLELAFWYSSNGVSFSSSSGLEPTAQWF